MTHSVHQHWDPLKICIVGKSYSPEFYSFVANKRVRNVLERIATETEEDYQKLIALLESFNVKVLRPEVENNWHDALMKNGTVSTPPMTPRDYSITIGDTFYINYNGPTKRYDTVINEIRKIMKVRTDVPSSVNAALITRIGKDMYFGTPTDGLKLSDSKIHELYFSKPEIFEGYRTHVIKTGGHSDGVFCPVKPGLIVSLKSIHNYSRTFPGWEVIYLPDQSWSKVRPFTALKSKNKGKWWVPGEELNDDFTEFVELWLNHWVGYVEETVFDVNMLVINEQNVVCNNYNKKIFDAFERHGVTPHIINFRHRYFWDGGLHCITSDVSRDGYMKDYFPEREKPL